MTQLNSSLAPPPFFIVGCGRSGTTLLRMMLAAHSRITIPPETWFLLTLVQRLPVDRVLTAQERNLAVRLITNHYRWPDMGISTDEFGRLAAELPEPRIRDLMEIIYASRLRLAGKTRWGDKTPHYIKIIPQLARIFPGARFICLIRDGRDVVKSMQKVQWYGPWLHDNTTEWVDAARHERRWVASGYGDQILRVRYEDLVTETEGTLIRICEFLGEQFEPQMLAWQGNIDALVPQRERHVHSKLTRTATHSDIKRWKSEMSPREVFLVEAFIRMDLRRYGYACQFGSPVWIPIFWAARVYCRSSKFLWEAMRLPYRGLRYIIRRVGREHGL